MKKQNKLVLIALFIIIGIVLIISNSPENEENKIKYKDDGTIIEVVDNEGMQDAVGVGQDIGNPDQNAATVDEITGKHPDMEGQPTNTNEMFGDKEIEI